MSQRFPPLAPQPYLRPMRRSTLRAAPSFDLPSLPWGEIFVILTLALIFSFGG